MDCGIASKTSSNALNHFSCCRPLLSSSPVVYRSSAANPTGARPGTPTSSPSGSAFHHFMLSPSPQRMAPSTSPEIPPLITLIDSPALNQYISPSI